MPVKTLPRTTEAVVVLIYEGTPATYRFVRADYTPPWGSRSNVVRFLVMQDDITIATTKPRQTVEAAMIEALSLAMADLCKSLEL